MGIQLCERWVSAEDASNLALQDGLQKNLQNFKLWPECHNN